MITAQYRDMAYCKFASSYMSDETSPKPATRQQAAKLLARTRGVRQHEALALVAGGQQHARLPDCHPHAHRVHLHPRTHLNFASQGPVASGKRADCYAHSNVTMAICLPVNIHQSKVWHTRQLQ